MGRPEKDGRCKKHPTHKNSNGVCPYCLRDRLASISGSSSSSANNGGSSSSSVSSTAYSSYDSDVSSSVESPPRHEGRNRKRLFQLLRGRKRTLKSSHSFSLSKEVERVSEKGKEEKKRGKIKGAGKLWEKLVMGGGGRKNQGEGRPTATLSHSKTVKEKSSSIWTFFS